MKTISELEEVNHYSTDKLRNGFSDFYELCFGRCRQNVKTVLELGVRRGGSLMLWRDYFPNANIIGLDIDISLVEISDRTRIDVVCGDATSQELAQSLIDKYKHFDVVVDDCSHLSRDIRKSFELYFSSSSMYLVEDLGTQYPSILGDFVQEDTSFVKDLFRIIDKNNSYPPEERDVKSMIFSSYLCCLIRKFI